MYKRLYVLAAIIAIAAFAFVPCVHAEPALSEPSVAEASPQDAKTVTAIEISGNKSISTNTIVSKMKTRIGGPYLDNVISDDLKRLYLLGFFSDIKIDTEDYQDGLKVVILVTERPIISKITFEGIHRLTAKDEKIKADLKSKEGQYLDYPILAEDVRTLKKKYEKIGYGQVQVDSKVNVEEQTNKAAVQFVVTEGGRVHIKDIFIEGNKEFKDGQILKLLKTKRGWLFNAGIMKDDVFKEDVERVKSFYRRQGYMDVTVDSQVVADQKRPTLLYVTITIQEGKKYLIGNVTIQGNKDVAEKEILARLALCTPGKVYSEDALKLDSLNIQGLYFDRGYISAQVQETTSLNAQTGRVDIAYLIVENQITYVDKIKVRGNIKTKDIVIRRELRIHPGDKFDGEKLRRSKERLTNLGFFDEISYDTDEGSSPDKKDLIVDVKESKTGAFSFGGGYSTVDQFVGFVEVEQKNFDWRNWPYFTGAGQNLKFRGSLGSISNSYDLSFTEPWLFDYPITFGFDVYKRGHDKDENAGYGYSESVTGSALRFGKEFTEYIRGDATYRYDIVEISDIAESETEELKKEEGTNTISSTTFGAVYDSRDNVFDIHKGDYISASTEFAGGMLGGDKNFWKFNGRVSHYIPLFRGSTLELRGRVGIGDSFGDSDSIPIYDRYFAGGAYTIRGYEERSIGPIDSVSKDPLGGNALLVGNIEYTYPLFSFMKAAAFYDTGNVWAKAEDLGKDKLYSSFGLGLRLKTPIGPITLDYGIPFDAAPGEEDKKSGRFHFSASHNF